MANAIPLLEGTDGSGGYLVSEQYGETLQNTILREGAALALSRVDRVVGRRQHYAVYAGRPTAAFVAEGAAKQATGAEFTEIIVNIKKIATIVLYTEEILEDAREDPRLLVNPDVQKAFSDLIDAHIMGYAAGSQITSQFDTAWRATTSTVEYDQTKADGVPLAVSAAMKIIELNGGRPDGFVLPSDGRAYFRDARASNTGLGAATPLFGGSGIAGGAQFAGMPGDIYSLNVNYSSNLPTLSGTAGAGRVVGFVGAFKDNSIVAMRRDMSVRSSADATVDVGGTLHHLWQQNKTALQWEMRLGHIDHDPNRMIVALVNAS